jgi:hypothetical protein
MTLNPAPLPTKDRNLRCSAQTSTSRADPHSPSPFLPRALVTLPARADLGQSGSASAYSLQARRHSAALAADRISTRVCALAFSLLPPPHCIGQLEASAYCFGNTTSLRGLPSAVDLTLHLFASAGAGDWRTVGLVVDLVLAAYPDRSPYSGTPQVYRCTRLEFLSNHIAVSPYHHVLRHPMCKSPIYLHTPVRLPFHCDR